MNGNYEGTKATNTQASSAETSMESKSVSSRGTRGSAVLARAREYNRIIDENRSQSSSKARASADDTTSKLSRTVITSSSQKERTTASSTQYESSSSSRSFLNGNAKETHASSPSSPLRTNPRSSPTPSQKSFHQFNDRRPSRSPTRNQPEYTNGSRSVTSKHTSSQRSMAARSVKSKNGETNKEDGQAVVTPEMLVDALSGHEDGLLVIAERLMEHYDDGYDSMGEAIIDAFADVQKLFQHVVEAAHMEGAAYEAGRKDEEIERLKRALGGELTQQDADLQHQSAEKLHPSQASNTPTRHEEFIDQDVRDIILDAIRKGQSLKDAHKFSDCYKIYENACNAASALLPVDSDHRGRLQLSIARAESMSPERACAILKYVMDDVLRSGLNSNSKVLMPDPSQRGDCVLAKPTMQSNTGAADDSIVLQSSEEALASMVEEMKEILMAPIYDNSPLQSVAERFWVALSEDQRIHTKNQERLEQKLATLKAEFLLAREEWEDKYHALSRKYEKSKFKKEHSRETKSAAHAREGVAELSIDSGLNVDDGDRILKNPSILDSPRGTIASSGSFSSLSNQAKSIVGNIACNISKKKARDPSPPSTASTKPSSVNSNLNLSRRPGGGRTSF